jgi:hypothetical protein
MLSSKMAFLNLILCALVVGGAVARPSAAHGTLPTTLKKGYLLIRTEKRQFQGVGNGASLFGGRGLGGFGANVPFMSPFIPLLPSAAQIAKRTPMQPVRTENTKPNRSPEAKRKQITWGPFQLQAVNVCKIVPSLMSWVYPWLTIVYRQHTKLAWVASNWICIAMSSRSHLAAFVKTACCLTST